MFTKFNKKLKTIFLDPHSSVSQVDEKVNIIISPTLYWVKKVSLPVKSVREALKLLPSIFEDTIPEANYSYNAYKSGDDFIVFAYEDKLILDLLSEKGIASANISNVYFAQSELENIEGAVKINDSQSIYMKDGLLILVPCCWIEESGNLDVSNITHSKHSITLAQFGHIVDSKSLYKVGSIVAALVLLLSIELFITMQKSEQIQTSTDELFSKYKLKSTMFQNKSMLKKYNAIHETQMRLRDSMGVLLSLKLNAEHKIDSIVLKDKKLVVSFSGVDKGKESYILKKLKDENIKLTSLFKEKTLELEMML